ncbi:MAG: SDR family NAD(P)-dependent oxidoreductase, partial [FCB group bacterium]|nr:SDR family NAD(P)-dependent oxidoreductase [FCB group bacterium]
MKDKICVITGATDGIGKAAAIALADKGARVVLVSRNEAKGQRVKEEIIQQTGNDRIDFFRADLSLLKEVREVASDI